jgi:hypothetical protein
MLEVLDNWLEPFRLRAWDAAYRREEQAARQAVADAARFCDSCNASADESSALAIALDFMDTQVNESFLADPEGRAGLLLDAITRIGRPQQGPLARAIQARSLLTLRCWAARFDYAPLTPAEVESLFNRIPYEDLEHHNWTFLSFWAFQQRDSYYLSLAYKQFLTKPFDFMIDFSRQRLKVMLQLVEGRCLDRDVQRLIELLPHLMHVNWMREHIVPACIDAGIWDVDLNNRLLRREQALIDAGPVPPPRERRQVSYKVNI